MSLKAMGNVTVINVNDGQDGAPGQQGAQGVSIVNSVPQYYLSTSSVALENGSWSYTPWEVTNGTFLWERLENTLSDGRVIYSDAVYSVTISGVKHDVDSINNSITNKVWQSDITTSINSYDNSTVSNIRDRVTQTETDITGITSRVSDVESDTSDLGTRMTSAETTIQQTSENVLIQATSSATTAAEGGQYLINSLINVAPSGVQIAADKVNIAGAAIFSNYALKSQTVSDVVVEYAKSTSPSSFSPVSGSDGEWSIGMPTWSEGSYIWQRTSKTINGNTTYSYTCIQGAKGQDGTSVSITEIKYATSSTDSQPSDSSFTYDSVPTVAEGSWLWTRTTYNSGTKLYTKSKQGVSGTNGTNGTNGLNVATVYLYQRATSSPSKPSSQLTYTFSTGKLSGTLGNWSQEIPSGTNPIWMTIATASANTTTDTIASSEWTTPVEFVKNGTDGINGTNGLDGYNQATINLYRRASSTPSKPSSAVTYTFATGALSTIPSGWSKTVPDSDGNPCYVTSVSIASRDATYSIAATSWSSPTKLVEDGEQGDHGLNVATIYLYQRATSSPAKPSSTLTYTFADGTLAGTLGSWEQSVPSGTNPVWMTLATASASTATDTIASSEWVDPVQLVKDGIDGIDGTDGIDGYNQATITLYRRAASAPSKPSSAVTYTFATGELSSIPSGWERTVPTSDGNPCYATSVTAIGRGDTYPISSSSWSDVVKLVEDGDSAVVYSITPSVYAITKNEAGTLTPTSVTFSATSKTGSGTASAYSGRFIIAESSNGTSWTNKYTSSGNESSKAYTPSANTIKFIRCSLYLAGGTTTLLDQETVAVVSDGIQGYSVVTYVTRDTFTESQWTTYGTVDHSESWSNTSDIRNGCRVGDLFAVVGTSTDGGKAHTAIYRATNASGNLAGTCIAHTFSDRGDDGDDAYTVILTNESHSFAAGTSAAVAGTATCKVITYKGASQIACYAGASSTATSISTNVTGLTCSISNNNSTNVTLTFSATTSLTTKNGTVSIPVVVDGKSFTKLFTFSLSLTGTSVTSVTTTQSDVDDGYSTVTITMSDGSSKQFQVKNGSKGSTGDTAQWFYGTALSHTSGTATASVTGAVVGSMYLNTDSSNVYKCTNISGSTMTWTYAGNLITGLLENLEFGGTNLILGSHVVKNKYINSSGAEANSTKCISSDFIAVDPSSPYTLQFWQPTNSQTGNNRAWTGKFCWYNSSKTYLNGYTSTYFADTHVSYTATSPSDAAYVRVTYQLPNGATVTPTTWTVFNEDYRWKLEKGNVPSDWSLAPEDNIGYVQVVFKRTNSSTIPAAPTSIVELTTDPGTSGDWTTMYIPRIASGNTAYKYLWTCSQKVSVTGEFLGTTPVVADNGTTIIDGDTITTGTVNADRLNINDIISRGSIIVTGSNISSLNNDSGFQNSSQVSGAISTATASLTSSISVETQYRLSNSDSSLTGSGTGYTWSTTIPTWSSGKYIWTRTATTKTPVSGSATTTYTPGTSTNQYGIYDSQLTTALSNSSGAAASVVTTQQYRLSTSSTALAGSGTGYTWSSTIPTWVANTYLWTRFKIDKTTVGGTTSTEYTPGTSTTEYGIYDSQLTKSLKSAVAGQVKYATSSTAAGTQAKVVTCNDFELVRGNEITITFSNANTYTNTSTHSAVQLNINSSGAKNVWVSDAVTSPTNRLLWGAGATVTFRCEEYNNDYIFVVISEPRTWSGASTTAAGTAAKTDTTAVTGCVICKGTVVELAMTNTNTNASPTLNIRSTGALPIYVGENTTDPRPLVSNNLSWIAGAVQQFRFDGVDWDCSLKSVSSYTTSINSNGLFIHKDTGAGALSITDPTANGIYISDDIDIIRSGENVARYGSSARIGAETSGHVNIASTGMDVYGGSGIATQLAHIGYDNTITDVLVSDGSTTTFTLSSTPIADGDVNPSTVKVTRNGTTLTVTSGLPSASSSFTYTYQTSTSTPNYLFGTKKPYYVTGGVAYLGKYSFATGYNVLASGECAHAEGYDSLATGYGSHAEGYSEASGWVSHSEASSIAEANHSHSEGNSVVTINASYAHAEGSSVASGAFSHSQNEDTIATKKAQTAIGTGNIEDESTSTTHPNGDASYGQYAFIIGNGNKVNRSNAFTVDWNGKVQLDWITRLSGKRVYSSSNASGETLYAIGNNEEVLRFATKTTSTTTSLNGISFMIANGYYAIGSDSGAIDSANINVYLCGGTDGTSKFIRSYPTYNRTYNSAANVIVTDTGTLGRSTSSSIRYKHDVEYLTNEENSVIDISKRLNTKMGKIEDSDILSVLDIPVVRFKFNNGYVNGESDFDYEKPIVGVIADDVANICQECATYVKDKNGNDIPESYDIDQIVFRMLYVIQQQEKRINELESQIKK